MLNPNLNFIALSQKDLFLESRLSSVFSNLRTKRALLIGSNSSPNHSYFHESNCIFSPSYEVIRNRASEVISHRAPNLKTTLETLSSDYGVLVKYFIMKTNSLELGAMHSTIDDLRHKNLSTHPEVKHAIESILDSGVEGELQATQYVLDNFQYNFDVMAPIYEEIESKCSNLPFFNEKKYTRLKEHIKKSRNLIVFAGMYDVFRLGKLIPEANIFTLNDFSNNEHE